MGQLRAGSPAEVAVADLEKCYDVASEGRVGRGRRGALPPLSWLQSATPSARTWPECSARRWSTTRKVTSLNFEWVTVRPK